MIIIKNARIVSPKKIINGDIVVDKNGKFKSVGVNGRHLRGVNESVDAQGRYVIPGLIEVHGHMREPGMTQKEDVPHGTLAALAGGFTTIIDMPNTNPPTTTVPLLKKKINKIYSNRAYTDYSFFMGVDKNNIEELEKVNPRDIAGIKVFMAGHETTPTTIPDDETLGKIAKLCKKRNLILAVHAEDQKLINKLERKFKQSDRTDPALWSELRPKEVVVKAVERIIKIAKKHNVKLYLLHLSTPEELELARKAKRAGLNVFSEVVSYQLLFNINDYKKLGNKIKVAPALRLPNDQDKLWKLFRKGAVDVICSEHTPHELKLKLQKNVWSAPSGMPNIQETLPALITTWTKRFGENSLEECLMTIAQLASQNPARIFGFDTKGEIKKGKDADFSILESSIPWKVRNKDLLSKCGWSAYEGHELIGYPVATFLRGKLVFTRP